MRATVRRPDGDAVELRIEGIAARDENDDRASEEPTPEELLAASLASCTATTMELYAKRKGWDVGEVEVDVEYTPAQRGSPTRVAIVVRLPEHLAPERRERLMQVGATSRMHRALEGEIAFEERLEITTSNVDPPMPTRDLPRRRIPLLNGLRAAKRNPGGRRGGPGSRTL